MLHEFVAVHRDAIIRRCRAKADARTASGPAWEELDHGVPAFLNHLEDALVARVVRNGALATTWVQQGQDLLSQGFSVSEVVHRYGDVSQVIIELAAEFDIPISTDDFRILNLCLDDAIAGAVTEFGRRQNQSTLDGEKARGNERTGFLAHEMRNLLNTAIMAFEVLNSGNVGMGGSTAAVLKRSLARARTLTHRSLAEVRLTQGTPNRERFGVSAFIDELVPDATLEGNARGIALRVLSGDAGVFIDADRQVLNAVVMNLLQNAFKFTRARTTVVLSVRATEDRVLFEIEDECGGLPGGDLDELFHPFEQRGRDRSGLGLGLAFSRSAVEAIDGRIYAHNRPEKGCIFTVDLPRTPVSADALV